MTAHLCVIRHDEDRSGVPAGPTTILLNSPFLFLFIVVSCCPLSMATELCTNPEFRHQDVEIGVLGPMSPRHFNLHDVPTFCIFQSIRIARSSIQLISLLNAYLFGFQFWPNGRSDLSIFYRLPNFPFCVHLYLSIYALRENPICPT